MQHFLTSKRHRRGVKYKYAKEHVFLTLTFGVEVQ